MVRNSFYECDICHTKLLIRYQVGRIDIPVEIYCPHCNTRIYGNISIENEEGIKENINNASYIEIELNECDYIAELSTEFLSDKIIPYTSDYVPISPFLKSNPFDPDQITSTQNGISLVAESKSICNLINVIFNLLRNNNYEYVRSFIEKTEGTYISEFKKNHSTTLIKNQLDALMYCKELMYTFMLRSLPYGKKDLIQNKLNFIGSMQNNMKPEFKKLIKYFNENHLFDGFLSKMPSIIEKYFSLFRQLAPVYNCYKNFEDIDQKEKGITTLNIEDLHDFYVDAYEAIIENSDILFALDNIKKRFSFNNFGKGIQDFKKEILSYGSKFNKYTKMLELSHEFAKDFDGIFNNIVRNSNAHNSVKINGLEQTITFIDKYNGRQRQLDMTFLDFGKNCVDIYVSLLVLWEYYYTVIKYKYLLIDKLHPNFAHISHFQYRLNKQI